MFQISRNVSPPPQFDSLERGDPSARVRAPRQRRRATQKKLDLRARTTRTRVARRTQKFSLSSSVMIGLTRAEGTTPRRLRSSSLRATPPAPLRPQGRQALARRAVNRGEDVFRRKTHVVGRSAELPRESNRLALEIIPKREIPQHLEERVVPQRLPHILEVAPLSPGAQALWQAGRT